MGEHRRKPQIRYAPETVQARQRRTARNNPVAERRAHPEVSTVKVWGQSCQVERDARPVRVYTHVSVGGYAQLRRVRDAATLLVVNEKLGGRRLSA